MELKVEPHDPELRIVQGSQGQRRETGFPVPSLNAMRPDLSGRGSTGHCHGPDQSQGGRASLVVASGRLVEDSWTVLFLGVLGVFPPKADRCERNGS